MLDSMLTSRWCSGRELVTAVDQGRMADQADVGSAPVSAAEITEREGDLGGALTWPSTAPER